MTTADDHACFYGCSICLERKTRSSVAARVLDRLHGEALAEEAGDADCVDGAGHVYPEHDYGETDPAGTIVPSRPGGLKTYRTDPLPSDGSTCP